MTSAIEMSSRIATARSVLFLAVFCPMTTGLCLFGCGSQSNAGDAGPADGSASSEGGATLDSSVIRDAATSLDGAMLTGDSGADDASLPDASLSDASLSDASLSDANELDSSASDSSSGGDSGVLDSAAADADSPDAALAAIRWEMLPGRALANTVGTYPQVEIDYSERVVLLWKEASASYGPPFSLRVERYETNWVLIGAGVNTDTTTPISDHQLALDATGQPVVAFAQGSMVTVRQYSTTTNTWMTLGGPLAHSGVGPKSMRMVVDDFDRPYLLLEESEGDVRRARAYRYDGAMFVALGSALLPPGATSSRPQGLALLSDGRLVAAVSASAADPMGVFLMVYESGAWSSLAGPIGPVASDVGFHELASIPTGPILAYRIGPADGVDAYRYDIASSMLGMREGPLDIGSPGGANYPSIAVSRGDGAPYIAFRESGIYVRRYTSGGGWSAVGPPVETVSGGTLPSVAIGYELPAVAWEFYSGPDEEVHVARAIFP